MVCGTLFSGRLRISPLACFVHAIYTAIFSNRRKIVDYECLIMFKMTMSQELIFEEMCLGIG
jgi:hypothetical protein